MQTLQLKEKVPIESSRRGSLAISALLNDVSIDPMQHPLAPSQHHDAILTTNTVNTRRNNKTTHFKQLQESFSNTDYSPISSGSSSPGGSTDYSVGNKSTAAIMNTDGLWNRSKTDLHLNNDNIIMSSLSKAKRKRISPHQYKCLCEIFEKTDTPSSEMRSQLAEELEMTKREVQVWFQNRRAKASRNKQVVQQQRRYSLTHNSSTRKSSLVAKETLTSGRAFGSLNANKSFSTTPIPYLNNPCSNDTFQHKDDLQDQKKHGSMVLEAPYQLSTHQEKSAIDLLASAAEMMRKN